jgi:diaminohydroxyphosphoribosylaminopyrimidine deaminase/5-amino-6-(5-phosphoribosylamino)uracil reductase
VAVECGLLQAEAEKVIPGFISRMRRGRPRVRAKLAMSVDGRTAMASGESQWITGPEARADVQRLRAMSCAILTGVGTVHSDDCSLTVREDQLGLPAGEARLATSVPPLRVVLDSQLRTPAGAKVLDRSAPTLLVHHLETAIPGAIESSAALRLAVPGSQPDGLDLVKVFDYLTARQCNEILVESGPRLAGALLQAGFLDELIIYMAPTLMGSSARPLFELPLERMAEQVPLVIEDIRRIGKDWRITAIPD